MPNNKSENLYEAWSDPASGSLFEVFFTPDSDAMIEGGGVRIQITDADDQAQVFDITDSKIAEQIAKHLDLLALKLRLEEK